jgi:hypothetical protein
MLRCYGAGVVTTLAGSYSSQNKVDGTGTNARLMETYGMAVDTNLVVYTADDNANVRKITSAGKRCHDFCLSLLAVEPDVVIARRCKHLLHWFSSLLRHRGIDHRAHILIHWILHWADRNTNYCRCLQIKRVLYVSFANNILWKFLSGVLTVIAGNGGGNLDGQGTIALFSNPQSMAVTTDGTVYVADRGNWKIRKISATNEVTTLSGSTSSHDLIDGPLTVARFSSPTAVTVDSSGTIFVADWQNNAIRKISVSAGMVTTIAGSGTYGENIEQYCY